MDFLTAVKTCFRKYFRFKGRARRSEFWYWTLFSIISSLVLALLDRLIFGIPFSSDGLQPLSDGFALATLIPGLAVSWRRLHDINRSGWWIGGGFLVIIIFVVLLLMAASRRLLANTESILENTMDIISVGMVLFVIIWGIVLLVFFCKDTKRGDNRFGEDPKYEQGISVFD